MKKLLLLCACVCACCSAPLAFGQAAAPVISPAAGTYASTQSVTVTDSTSGADIFCTTDGSTPTPESAKYTGALTVNSNQTVKCIAAVAGIRRTNIQNDDPSAAGTYWKAADYANGGAGGVPTGLVHSSGHASPSLSGASMEFSMTAHGSQTNVLWAAGTGFGKCDTCSYELFDYQLYLDTGVCTNNGTTEQDDFKIASSLGNLRYMGGAQWRRTGGCTSGHACLDFGGNSNVHWTFSGVNIPLACGTFHHMQRAEHFVPSEVTSKPCVDFNGAHWPYLYEDYWIVDGTKYDNGGAGWKYCINSVNWPSWEAPQFQFDATTGTHTMYLDQANFTAYFPASTVSTSAYAITGGTGTPTATTPSISPAGGLGLTSSQTVTITDSTPGAVIHYTTDGSTPTSSSTTYSSALTVTTTTTVKAIAIATGYNNSAVASAVYSFSSSGGLTATPVLSPAAGSYAVTQYVSMSDTTSGAVIYFTTDGTTPTTASNVYSVPLAISATATVKAMAVAPGLTNSSVASGTYTITATLIAATPTFSPLAGNYASTQTVSISDTTPSSVIHYTTDGSTPTGASTTYSTPLSIAATTTVKAIAVASGYSNSPVGVALYTIGCGLTPYATGNIDYSQLKAASRRGAGVFVQMAAGGFTTNDLPIFDCNGNIIDGGALLSALATKSAVQQESYIYAADTGTANAYAIALSPAPTIVAGSIATLKVGHTNTGASTLAVNGGSATAVKKGDGTVALAAGDWTAGQIVTVKYDGISTWQWGGGSGGGITQLTGDATAGPGSGSQAVTLASTAVAAGSYTCTNITVDAKGRITSAANGTCTGGSGITQLTGDATAGPGSGSQAVTLATTAVTAGSYTCTNITVDAKGRITAATNGTCTGGSGITQLTGDATAGPGSGSQAVTLASTAVTAGSYTCTNITVDAKGRITSAANGTCTGGGFSVYPTMTTPLSANFSWLNPNSSAVTNTDATARLILTAPTNTVGAAFMQTAALPSTPYTIDLGFIAQSHRASTILVNIALKNSGGNALRTYGLRSDSGGLWDMQDQTWTSITSPSTQNSVSSVFADPSQLFFLRITDDGTNRKTYWSTNGKDYELFLSQATNTGVTPDRVGIAFYNTNGNPVETVSVYHWLISGSVLAQYAP